MAKKIGWKKEYIKIHSHKDGKCLNCGLDVDLCVCSLPVLEAETRGSSEKKKWNRHLKFVTDKGKEILMYNSERTDGQFRFCCPPETVYSLLWQAWIEMQPGIYSPYGKASAEEIADSLRARCVSMEAAEWASRKADEYYKDKIGFEVFAKKFKGEEV